MQFGNFSSAYFTTAIAVHTFNSLVMKRRQSVIICRSTITIGWVWAGLTGRFYSFIITKDDSDDISASAPFLIHGPEGYVYGADGLACAVRPVYPKSQFFFHLLPVSLGDSEFFLFKRAISPDSDCVHTWNYSLLTHFPCSARHPQDQKWHQANSKPERALDR